MSLQTFAPLDEATEAALRASINQFGVLIPVMKDQHGRIIDGHHRTRLAAELGVECPHEVREVANDDEARELARTLNTDRRHLTAAQRRSVVAALREQGHSTRAIANAVGVDKKQVQRDLEEVGTVSPPDRVTGKDGKSYPATRRAPKQPTSGRQPRADRAEQIRALASSGMRSNQIAEEIGLGEAQVRAIARDEGIDIVADRIVPKSRVIDSLRIVRETALTLDGATAPLALVDVNTLSTEDVADVLPVLADAIRKLSTFHKQLKGLNK